MNKEEWIIMGSKGYFINEEVLSSGCDECIDKDD